MDYELMFIKFLEKYPQYEREIVSYDKIPDNGFKFYFADGRTGVYYPLITDSKKEKKKKNGAYSKQHNNKRTNR